VSCTLIKTPHATQIDAKQRFLATLIADARPADGSRIAWLEPFVSAEQGFRTKAKMVVGGSADAPTLGILDAHGAGVDLSDCPLYGPHMAVAFPVLAQLIGIARLTPYDLDARSGELKNVIVTVSPAGELMVRFVCRSTEPLARLQKHLPWLLERLPPLVVVTLNVLPEHKAVLEGEREIVLTERAELHIDMGSVVLRARPQSFLQTNTDIAHRLCEQVAEWVDEGPALTVRDLYCGVGGFALHRARPGRTVAGVESSEQAVISAQGSAAARAGTDAVGAARVEFVAADATTWITGRVAPDVVIVNPPRRGIGAQLAAWIESSGVPRVVYSSCNAVTLAKDLAAMPSLAPVKGRLLDMFPHTEHFEAVVLLERS
jgi:23S rRNA (uracil747-C5)-methyltransferase